MSKKFTLVLFMLPLFAIGTLSLLAQNSALSFNSATQDHATTNVGAYSVPNTPAMTVELWAYVPVAQTGQHNFISQGIAGNAFIIGYDGDNSNHIILGDNWVGGGDANVPLPIGQWNHIALTLSAGDTARLFLNGVLVATDPTGDYFVLNIGTQTQLGTSVDSTTFFTGELDQVRTWNFERTAAQVKHDMYGITDSTSAGLISDYLFDPGSGINRSSASTTGLDLTLLGSTTTASSPIQPGNNGVKFDKTANSQINAPGNAALDLTTGTIEAWVNPNTVNGAIVAVRNASNARFSIHLNNTSIPAFHYVGIYNSVNNFGSVFYPAGFTAGTWYHIALVTAPGASNDTTGVYVNGAYVGNINQGYGTTVPSSLPFTIGGNGADNTEQWDGSIDEVRIWNTPLTQLQIQANMGSTLTGNEPGLVSLYSFDQGIPDGDNTGLKVAVDNAPLTNNGLLSNFALTTASASNFTLHTLVPLPLLLTQFTVVKQNNTAFLQWQTAQEENTKDFTIQRSPDGKNYTDIGSVPAAGTSHIKLNYYYTDEYPVEGKNYYRLKQSDLDSRFTYSPIRVLAFTNAGKLIWSTNTDKSVEVRLQNGSNELYSITDMGGRAIRTGRLSSGVTTLSSLPGGVYFVKVVTNAGNTLTAKVLLNK